MASCVGQPISWLVLEQYALDELPAARASQVSAHLEACELCRDCADSIGASRVALRPLAVAGSTTPKRVSPRRPWWRRPVFAGGLAATLVATAVVLLWLRTGKHGQGPQLAQQWPPQRLQVKGGELALALVGDRGGVVRHDPVSFRDGDRFKVLVTCPPGRSVADVVVAQDGKVFFPLAAQSIGCGNRVVLDGAFRVDGASPITICAVVGPPPGLDRRALDVDRLRRSKRAVCQTLQPATSKR